MFGIVIYVPLLQLFITMRYCRCWWKFSSLNILDERIMFRDLDLLSWYVLGIKQWVWSKFSFRFCLLINFSIIFGNPYANFKIAISWHFLGLHFLIQNQNTCHLDDEKICFSSIFDSRVSKLWIKVLSVSVRYFFSASCNCWESSTCSFLALSASVNSALEVCLNELLWFVFVASSIFGFLLVGYLSLLSFPVKISV